MSNFRLGWVLLSVIGACVLGIVLIEVVPWSELDTRDYTGGYFDRPLSEVPFIDFLLWMYILGSFLFWSRR